MGLRFYIGGSGSGKSFKLYSDIIEQSIEQPKTNFLIVVPDQFTMQTQKDLVCMHPNKGIMNIDVLSFGRLTHRIFEEVGGNRKPILDDTGKSLILRQVSARTQNELQVIGKNLGKIGYVHEIKSAISEFMQYGIGEKEMEELIAYAGKRGALKYKLEDLSVLYKEFTQYIKEKYITTEETLDVLCSVLPKSNLLKDAVIVFDGFTGFTPVQNRVIGELMVLTREVIVTALVDARENPFVLDGEQRLFHLSKKTIDSLCKIAQEKNVKREPDIILGDVPSYRYKHNPSLSFLEQNLFRYEKNTYQGDHSLFMTELTSPKEEVINVSRQIKNLIRTKGICYRDIAVITGDLSTYASHFEEEFQKFEIPYFMDQTRGILLNPFTEFIRSALQVIEKNFTYEGVFHYLRSGLVGLAEKEIDELENYVLGLGIRGKKKWESLFTRHSRETAGDGEKLEALNKSRERIIESLTPLMGSKTRTVGEWVRALYEFILEADIQKQLMGYEQHFTSIGDLSRAKEYAQIYPLVMQLLEQLDSLLGEESMKLMDFSDILDAGFAEIEVGSIPQNVDRVVVGDMERTRLKEIKVLFFVGLNDGIIPKSAGKGGIISDIDREYLRDSKLELAPSPREKMYIQRLYLYMNMTKPTESLYLSYAKVNGEGKSIRPAYLVDMILKLFPDLQVVKPEMLDPMVNLVNEADGMSYFVELLRNYAAGQYGEDEKKKENLQTLFHILQENNGNRKIILDELMKQAFFHYEKSSISRAVAEVLYGKMLENSVSRLETFAACAYSHFLQYGLTLREREEYSFENTDMGNIFHGVLEQFSKYIKMSEYTWFDFPQEFGEEMLQQAVDQYSAEYGESILFSSSRNQYVITRLKRILSRTIMTLQHQLKQGLFTPEQFEVSFSLLDDLSSVNIALSEEERIRLRGRIDRIDTYEKDNQIYVKVIDYKSGAKDFDLVALYYGLQLQLVVYLNAAVELEQKQNPGKEVIPAALLYYHVDDPMTEREGDMETPEEINERLMEKLRMRGIVQEDAEIIRYLDQNFTGKSQVIPVEETKSGGLSANSKVMNKKELELVSNYVTAKIASMGKEMLQGKMELNPYELGGKNACTYCNFKSVCGFDVRLPGYEKRELEALKKDEIMQKLEEGENL